MLGITVIEPGLLLDYHVPIYDIHYKAKSYSLLQTNQKAAATCTQSHARYYCEAESNVNNDDHKAHEHKL